jgi:HK97 family phage prohead protease
MELRTITEPINVESREAETPIISGYAAVFNTRVSIGGLFDESVDRRAFNRVLTEKQDVKALFDHNSSFVLGRTANGTLTLSVDQHGLKDEIRVNDKVSYARDLIENIRRHDIFGQSFSFKVSRERWDFTSDEGKPNHRIILEIERLYDVGPVTYPAYETTSIAARHVELQHRFHEVTERVNDVHGLEISTDETAVEFSEIEGRNYIVGPLERIEKWAKDMQTKRRSQRFKWIKEKTRLALAENLY